MFAYPTKDEILNAPLKYPADTLRTMKAWKREKFNGLWKVMSALEKFEALAGLVGYLAEQVYHKPVHVQMGERYSYSPATETITFDGNHPSIISALHELGHHLRGRSELEACRWSVHLFMRIFPRQYERLEWNGHMLVKASSQPDEAR